MLSLRIKTVVASCALVFASSAFADSPVTLTKTQKSSNSVKTASAKTDFNYPVSTLIESDFTETGVMFVYNDHILDYFNGDSEKLLAFINSNIDHNNQAFVNSNIGLKRVVSGLVYVESDDLWSATDTYTDRLRSLVNWETTDAGSTIKQQSQYSYLVSLAGYQKSEGEITMLGQAFLGDNVSWISPFNTDADLWIDRTLAHELSHNDGFKHASEDYKDGPSYIVRHDAAGHKCGSHGSIMYISGLRTEPFFSDAEISLETNQQSEDCGVVGEANAAQVYRDLLSSSIANSEGTFDNIQSTRAKTGVVSIQENVSVAMEGLNIEFDVVFEGADKGDSINFVVRQGTAGLNDFNSTIGTVTHDGINNVYTMTVATLTDNIDEAAEQFSVELIYPNGVTINSASSSIDASIVDKNDDAGYVEFSTTQVSVIEGDDVEVTINRVGGNEGLITYQVETITDSATQSDFESYSQTITFNNGETSKTLLIKTLTDTNVEQDETFMVKITQTLHPLYAANTSEIKSELKVTINNPVAASNTSTSASNTAVAANTTATVASSQNTVSSTSQGGGGSLNIFWAMMLLLVAVRRIKR